MLTPFQHNTLLTIAGRAHLNIANDSYADYVNAARWLRENGYLSLSYRITKKGKAYFDDLEKELAG